MTDAIKLPLSDLKHELKKIVAGMQAYIDKPDVTGHPGLLFTAGLIADAKSTVGVLNDLLLRPTLCPNCKRPEDCYLAHLIEPFTWTCDIVRAEETEQSQDETHKARQEPGHPFRAKCAAWLSDGPCELERRHLMHLKLKENGAWCLEGGHDFVKSPVQAQPQDDKSEMLQQAVFDALHCLTRFPDAPDSDGARQYLELAYCRAVGIPEEEVAKHIIQAKGHVVTARAFKHACDTAIKKRTNRTSFEVSTPDIVRAAFEAIGLEITND